MIRAKMNLVCSAGHEHYSPTPRAFVGQSCLKPFENPMRKDGYIKVTAARCYEQLRGT